MAPKGYKLVPEIPTVEMLGSACPDDPAALELKERMYKEMIAAAPQAPLAVVPLVDTVYDKLSKQAQGRTSRENIVDTLHALISAELRAAPHDGSLKVWYGPMPESNGKHNYTAILHRGDISEGITIARSEYPDRVLYEADQMRYLIGEIDKEPWILDYDAEKHSGYREPAYVSDKESVRRVDAYVRKYRTRKGLDQECIHGLDNEYNLIPADIEELVRTARRVPSIEEAREYFEEAFRDHGASELERVDDGYKSPVTNCLWIGYKLGRGLPK